MTRTAFDESTAEITREDAFTFLVNLRDSGITNMWGASPYLVNAYGISKDEAAYWLVTWIKSFKE